MEHNPQQYTESWVDFEPKLREKIAFAKAHAFSCREEFEAILQNFERLVKQSKTTNMTSDDQNHLRACENALLDATVKVASLVEMRWLLESLEHDEDTIESRMIHENAHANVASMLGADHLGYAFTLITAKDGEHFDFVPMTRVGIPHEWSEEKKSQVRRAIYYAPEVYGDEMSMDDKKQVDLLKKK